MKKKCFDEAWAVKPSLIMLLVIAFNIFIDYILQVEHIGNDYTLAQLRKSQCHLVKQHNLM